MMRSVHKGAVLIVEGSSDLKMYSRFTDPGVMIQIAHSKEKVIESVTKLYRGRGDDLVIGIVDADLDLALGRRREPPIFMTDLRDMEMMAIASPAIDSVMIEYGIRDRIAEFESKRGPFRQAVVDCCYLLGLLMRISHDRGLSLSFKDVDFGTFTNPRSLHADIRFMVREVISKSKGVAVSEKTLSRIVAEESASVKDRWPYARGHDAVDVILLALKNGLGSPSALRIGPAAIGSGLRMSYDWNSFSATKLCKDTLSWAEHRGVPLWIVPARNPLPSGPPPSR